MGIASSPTNRRWQSHPERADAAQARAEPLTARPRAPGVNLQAD
jgi:hypothetical protein